MTLPEQEKYAIDAAAAVGTGGAFLRWLPDAVAAVTLVWVLVRLWETDTVKGLVSKLRGQ